MVGRKNGADLGAFGGSLGLLRRCENGSEEDILVKVERNN